MKTWITDHYVAHLQKWMYDELNALVKDEAELCGARLCSLPVVLIDVALETLKMPAKAIEALALVIINFLGLLCCSEICTIKGSLESLDRTVAYTVLTPVAAATSPLKFLYQLSVTFYDPAKAKPYNSAAVEDITDESAFLGEDKETNPATVY